MIISIRGASGAGKSTLVRRVLDTRPRVPHYQFGRQKPVYYDIAGKPPVAVLGHYEITNGGVDTLKTLDDAYELARLLSHTHHVLMEGKCMSDGVRHVHTLHEIEKRKVRVLFLDTSLADCVASVRERGHSIAEHSIEKTWKKIKNDHDRLVKMRIPCYMASRHEAQDLLSQWLEESL